VSVADLPPFEVRVFSEPDGTAASHRQVVRVTGEIDVTTSPELGRVISTAIGGGADQVLVDLAATGFIDASGIGVLVGAAKRARGAGGQLVIREPSEPVRRLLELLRLNDELVIWDGGSESEQ
jgi:anti-sigma B factor antagonist